MQDLSPPLRRNAVGKQCKSNTNLYWGENSIVYDKICSPMLYLFQSREIGIIRRFEWKYKKNYPIETGKIMREKYESGLIRNEHEFKEMLNNVLSSSERS